MAMKPQELHETALKACQKRAKAQLKGSEFTRFSAFLEGFYPVASPEDLMVADADTLYAIAYSMFRFSETRKGDEPLVRVINSRGGEAGWKTDHSIIQLVNPNMPFLVDSITGAVSTGLRSRIHMMHHPIVQTARDKTGKRCDAGKGEAVAESCIYMEISAQSDPDVLLEIEDVLTAVLEDVHAVVADWKAMLAKIDETVASLTVNPPPVAEDEVSETITFLRWLAQDHFTFLGFREYRFDGEGDDFAFSQLDDSGFGILRDEGRYVLRDAKGLTPMSPEIQHFLKAPDALIITKANVKSTVHRIAHMDYIGVKIFDKQGKAIGERRFVGLFTSLSYSQFARDVPILRGKVRGVRDRAPFAPRSYAAKMLNHVLETFPRDELWQIDDGLLYETAMGILQLSERPRPRGFFRPDRFERFVSCLIYVPRENYHSGLRVAIGDILCDAYNGEISVYYAQLSEQALARWHFIIRTKPGQVKKPDPREINAKIADAAQGWTDRLLKHLIERNGEERGNKLDHYYRDKFSAAYREAFTPAQAAYDIEILEEVSGKDVLRVDFYRHLADGDHHYRLKIHHGTRVVPLSDCMPVLENMGFRVLGENSFELSDQSGGHIHDFRLERDGGCDHSLTVIKPLVEDLFEQVWQGVAEEDGFNELVLTAAMSWDEIVILRAYGKYLRQLGLGYTPDYIADCVVDHAGIAAKLVTLFRTLFDPSYKTDTGEDTAKAIIADITADLETIKSLDQDRIMRAYLNVIQATLRTNFYQPAVLDPTREIALAFKIKSSEVDEAPKPRPFKEMWVYSPRVEGVHLRGGPVARGGLRWSDRREDFRTEVLGLVKAQQVKNAVIVPKGAKGGFYPKKLPPASDRDGWWAEGQAAYRTFISSLLSVTDNLVAGEVVPPAHTIRRDGDDPYLVVAADKGTATFSDIANGISEGADFWLDDAFASGGSNGYDHKKMGITARGAWVSVQRLFREMGTNVQEDPISVIGVGDMSGDVFGNGMLLSKAIKLKAAFNHLHIFVDPNPGDGAANWAERKRLFDTPRSSWTDYDAKLISKGGGVFSRADKTIPLSTEMRDWLKVSDKALSPTALINAILKAEADLLWFGGIGTYVAGDGETPAEVGDRANDGLRVKAGELRVKVVGEGGNLGMTQKARIEFARKGGRLHTDFIDNSAGVDCSDKEVNIKILLSQVMADGKLKRKDRDTLLEAMTDEVAEIVLSDNYLQTQAISLAEAGAARAREYHLGLIRALERDGGLDREIEYLPSDEKFAELAANDLGLTRPEISVLLAYAKMSLSEILLRGSIIDDPVLRPELEWGFPTTLREKYDEELGAHRLRREIVSTVLANEVVNWGGLTFVYEIKEETGLAVEDIVAAFVVVREIYGLRERWEEINALDYKVASKVQYDMHQAISEAVKTQVLWMLRNLEQPFNIAALIKRFRAPVDALFAIDAKVVSKPVLTAYRARRKRLMDAGVPDQMAGFVAGFEMFKSGADIIHVSEETSKSVDFVAAVHFAVGNVLGFDWLRGRAERIKASDHWDSLAIRSTVEDLADQQRELVYKICWRAGDKSARDAIAEWRADEKTKIIRVDRLMDDLSAGGSVAISKLSFAARHLRSILK